jgi:hypothetical protein
VAAAGGGGGDAGVVCVGEGIGVEAEVGKVDIVVTSRNLPLASDKARAD